MTFYRLICVLLVGFCLGACGEDTPESSVVKKETAKPVETQSDAAIKITPENKSAGGVTVKILPEQPTSSDCLTVIVRGTPGRNAVVWSVNDSVVSSGTKSRICQEHYRRGDIVSVAVGTNDQGGKASVEIGNSPPSVVDISSTPDEIYAGTSVYVEPVAEDVDEDSVTFSYQWLINGEENPNYTEATLPGDAFSKGDSLQVLITPNDFYVDGPVYESYATPVPNAAPRIVSEPPSEFKTLDYRYQVEVSDPDDTQFTFRLDEGPDGMAIDPASGLVRWSLDGVEPGQYTVAIIVTDPEGAEGAQGYTLTLGAPQ